MQSARLLQNCHFENAYLGHLTVSSDSKDFLSIEMANTKPLQSNYTQFNRKLKKSVLILCCGVSLMM